MELSNLDGKKLYIIYSFYLLIIILFIIQYFNIEKFNDYINTIVMVIFILIGGLSIAMGDGLERKVIKIAYSGLIILPLSVLSFINIKYRDTINKPDIDKTSYNGLKNLTNTLLIFQTIIAALSFESINLTNVYGSIIITLCNLICAGLMWRNLAFFITDG